MLSVRAQIFNVLLRNRNLLSPRKKGEALDWNTNEAILSFRQEVEDGAKRFGKLPSDVSVIPVTIESLYAEWISTESGPKNKVILYFHGGGYVSGTCQAHRGIVAKFVKGSGMNALLFEYRLAPEHPFPAALDDAMLAYRWLLGQGLNSVNIIFAGDSGGGGLCLATLLAIRDQGLPLPSAAVVLSPYTDLKCSSESHKTNLKKCLSPEGTGLAFGKHYAGGQDLELPYISPLYGELHGLPSLLIYAGGDETLRDDSVMFAEKAKQAGVDVTLRVGEGLFHCYPAMSPLFPEATHAMEEICSFMRQRASTTRIT